MTTFSWKNGISADWTITADWNPGGFPNATDAAAVIAAAGAYTVTIGAGETQIVNSLTLGNNFVGGSLAATPTLEIAGTLQLAGTSPTSAFLQGALLIDGTGMIEGAGALGAVSLGGVPFSFINNGVVRANAGAGTNLFVDSAFTNNGTVLADSGSVFIEGANLSNFSGTTLTGGSYIVQGPTAGTFNQIGFAINSAATDIGTDAANIVLDGLATRLLGFDGSSFQPLENQLQTIASGGSLQLLDGRGYLTGNALTDDGLLNLRGGSLATGGLTIGNGGLFEGFGVVSGSVSDSGSIDATGGALYVPGAVGGSGSLTIEPGASLILAGATPAAVANNGVIFNTSGLLDINALSGSGTLVVQNNATLDIGVATSQSIVFSGTNAHVTLGTPLLYSGTLTGFAQGDTLVLSGLSASSAVVVNNNTLAVISGGSTVDTVTLAGNYAGASFSATTVGGNAVISNLTGAPLRSDMPFSISLNDTAGLTGTQETQIENDLSAAALDWGQYITGHAPLRIQLNISSGSGGSELANGGFTGSIATGETLGGETIYIPSSIYALTTGNYLAGTTADIVVNLPLSASELNNPGGLYVNPNPPVSGGTVPANEFDLLSVFRHELAHGLGFSGFTGQDGSLGGNATLFDHYIQDTVVNGTITAANFIGPDAEAAYGAFLGTNIATPVPLTLLNNGENFFHVANASGDPLGQDLMSGVGLSTGQSRDISTVDMAMLQDVGLPVTADVLCFLRGTYIATPEGEHLVERLAVGDLVLTRSGAARPIVWIGVGRVLAARGQRSAATPVIVRKGALGDNVPHRDLRLTKAHALYFGGALIPVEFLVNHRSILWDDHAQEVALFHIELATHDVLLANGAPAESYRDDGNRWLFQNANSGWHLPPQEPCAPVLTGGAFVDAVWQRLLHRAGPRPGVVLTEDPDLHLLVDGERVDAAMRHGTAHIFNLAAPRDGLRIVSRSGAPAELGVARDPRLLGVALRRIALRQATRFRVIEAADPALADGFHPFEVASGLRWTDGDATLPASWFDGFAGPMDLVLHLGCTTQYPLLRAAAA